MKEESLFSNIGYFISKLIHGLKYGFLGIFSFFLGALLFFGLFSEDLIEELDVAHSFVQSFMRESSKTDSDPNNFYHAAPLRKVDDSSLSSQDILKAYNFDSIKKSFGGINISRVNEVSKLEFERIILSSVPLTLRGKLKPFLKTTLAFSEKYQVDPFGL